ncbi:MAG TPA: hypothetical protein VIR63_03605 [Pontiella sp.]
MKTCRVSTLISAVLLFIHASALAENLDLQLESGGVWFSKNDARIPGDTGTKFDLMELTGDGPDPYIRLYATYNFNEQHALRLTFAPLEVNGTGMLSKNVLFEGELFAADTPTKGTYKFSTYRMTYRRMFDASEPWRWGLGATLLIRDAEIALEQGAKRQSKDDLGLVPLLHLYGEYRFTDQVDFILDVDGAWSPAGRAVDMALKAQYGFDNGWYASLGYRTLEGGADNDDTYTFAWIHFAQIAVGCRF